MRFSAAVNGIIAGEQNNNRARHDLRIMPFHLNRDPGEAEEGKMLFKFHQNKYPEDTARVFASAADTEATWLDEALRAV